VAGGFDHLVRCASAGCVTAAQLAANQFLSPFGFRCGSAAVRRLSSAEPATKYAVVLYWSLHELALEQDQDGTGASNGPLSQAGMAVDAIHAGFRARCGKGQRFPLIKSIRDL